MLGNGTKCGTMFVMVFYCGFGVRDYQVVCLSIPSVPTLSLKDHI